MEAGWHRLIFPAGSGSDLAVIVPRTARSQHRAGGGSGVTTRREGRGHSRAAWGLTQPRTAATQTRSRTRSCTAATHGALHAGMEAHACEWCEQAATGRNTQPWCCKWGHPQQRGTEPRLHGNTALTFRGCRHRRAHSHAYSTHAYTHMHTHTHAHIGEAHACATVQHSCGLRTSSCSHCTQRPPAAPTAPSPAHGEDTGGARSPQPPAVGLCTGCVAEHHWAASPALTHRYLWVLLLYKASHTSHLLSQQLTACRRMGGGEGTDLAPPCDPEDGRPRASL